MLPAPKFLSVYSSCVRCTSSHVISSFQVTVLPWIRKIFFQVDDECVHDRVNKVPGPYSSHFMEVSRNEPPWVLWGLFEMCRFRTVPLAGLRVGINLQKEKWDNKKKKSRKQKANKLPILLINFIYFVGSF